jgi:hypothetical protein
VGTLPRTAKEAKRGQRRDVTDLQQVYFANRGIREAIYSAGPCVGIAHTSEDVDRYHMVLAEFTGELTGQFPGVSCGPQLTTASAECNPDDRGQERPTLLRIMMRHLQGYQR